MENELTPEDELKAENELLKLKLEMEHGMKGSGSSGNLPPEIENAWLNHMYEFEKQFKDAKQIKISERIDNEPFKKADELSPSEMSSELERLNDVLEQNGLRVDFLAEYEDVVKYKFITEELFGHEIDDIQVKGMSTNFIYEEFHPNHDYDLRRMSIDFIERILTRAWEENDHKFTLHEEVVYNDTKYNSYGIAGIIQAFQAGHSEVEIENIEVTNIQWDLDAAYGEVEGSVTYTAKLPNHTIKKFNRKFTTHHEFSYDWWSIDGFSLSA